MPADTAGQKFGMLLHAIFSRGTRLSYISFSPALEFPHNVNPLQDTGCIRQVGPHMKSRGLISRVQNVPNQFVGLNTVEKQVQGALKHILFAESASTQCSNDHACLCSGSARNLRPQENLTRERQAAAAATWSCRCVWQTVKKPSNIKKSQLARF